ncbi:MAG TPA: helix-turn-helix transcriptional regulator [Gammaproteobacteria bacterium]
MKIGARIRQSRLARSQTLEDLATATKIPWMTLTLIENDQAFPRLRELERLLVALDTTLDKLLRDESFE